MNMRHRSGGNPGDLFTVRLPLFLGGEMLRKRHRLASKLGVGKMRKMRAIPSSQAIWKLIWFHVNGGRCWLQGLAAATLIDSHRWVITLPLSSSRKQS